MTSSGCFQALWGCASGSSRAPHASSPPRRARTCPMLAAARGWKSKEATCASQLGPSSAISTCTRCQR